jgi:hypothetical protein
LPVFHNDPDIRSLRRCGWARLAGKTGNGCFKPPGFNRGISRQSGSRPPLARTAADGNCSILGQSFGKIWKFHLKSKINDLNF